MRITKALGVCLFVAMATFGTLRTTTAHADVFFDNFNEGIIFDLHGGGGIPPYALPANPTTFTLSSDSYIDQIVLYHFNDPATTDTISLMLGADVVGTFAAAKDPAGTFPFVYMVAPINTAFAAGTYTIVDTGVDWWSWNEESNDEGFATVSGHAVPVPGALALLGLGLVGLASRRRRAA